MSMQAAPQQNPGPTQDPFSRLRDLLDRRDAEFFPLLRRATAAASGCEDLLRLSVLRKRAVRAGFAPRHQPIRVAIVGAYTWFPLNELAAHFLATSTPVAWDAEFLLGDFDNYMAEIADGGSRLYEFRPDVMLLLPSQRRCRYGGELFDSRDRQEGEARQVASSILELCRTANERSGAEIVLANFPLPGRFDPGPYRTRTLGSDWSFRKMVNLELGLGAPSYVHLCDVEFLSARRGTAASEDPRAWFESKQPYGRELLADVAREIAHLIACLRRSPKKVAVLDLDNTLWGGVVGDDGLDGIEIGDTSPRGEAFKAFQQHLLSLTRRGVLLAVCSKNDHAKAMEAFEKHPEMVLRPKDFAAFKANWEPKSENLRQIAAELNLGLDSLVFIDDNPAEIEIVRQFAPEVETILLGPDPAEYVGALQDSRLFEPKTITAEDAGRAEQYRSEADRRSLLASVTDMDAYLASLDMTAAIREFRPVDVARIAQLINKSNQFNLTTRRRTEGEVAAILSDPSSFAFTVRLADRFGDHGLISVVICETAGAEARIDTWLMSCRVLKRQVEEEVLNEIVRIARLRGCAAVRGVYIPSAKNGMVRDHYSGLGFAPAAASGETPEFVLDIEEYKPRPTRIRVTENAYESN